MGRSTARELSSIQFVLRIYLNYIKRRIDLGMDSSTKRIIFAAILFCCLFSTSSAYYCKLRVSSASHCQKLCYYHSKCRAFDSSGSTCILKTGLARKFHEHGWYAGAETGRIYKDTAIRGSNLLCY